MAKKIVGFIKLQVPAGKANPSPPIGPALGQRGLNIMEFCKAFNAQTQGIEPGLKLPVVITAYADKSFTFVLKSPPATVLLKKAAKIEKGSGKPHLDKVGKVTRAQLEEIAKTKMKDLTAADLDAAVGDVAVLVQTARGGQFELDVDPPDAEHGRRLQVDQCHGGGPDQCGTDEEDQLDPDHPGQHQWPPGGVAYGPANTCWDPLGCGGFSGGLPSP